MSNKGLINITCDRNKHHSFQVESDTCMSPNSHIQTHPNPPTVREILEKPQTTPPNLRLTRLPEHAALPRPPFVQKASRHTIFVIPPSLLHTTTPHRVKFPQLWTVTYLLPSVSHLHSAPPYEQIAAKEGNISLSPAVWFCKCKEWRRNGREDALSPAQPVLFLGTQPSYGMVWYGTVNLELRSPEKQKTQ